MQSQHSQAQHQRAALGPQTSTSTTASTGTASGKQVVELNGYVIIVVESRDNKIKLYGSPADRDNLEVGDEILDVNERKLEDLPRAEVIRYIHECIQSCVIKLRVKRRSDSKLACRDSSDPPPPKPKRNCVPDDCFDRCKLSPEGKEARRQLFASKYPVSEYMDNVNRIGHVIMNTNFHCHQKCRRRECEHPFVVDLNADIFRKPKCEYINTVCGGLKSKFKPKKDYYYKEGEQSVWSQPSGKLCTKSNAK